MSILTVIDYYREIQMDAVKLLYSSTCHYMVLDEDKNPQPHGTGVFVEIDDNYFLLTAGHVADGYENEISVGIGKNEILTLGGEFTMNRIANGDKREEDDIDIAVLKLNDETVAKLKRQYMFLPKFELGVNHEDVHLPEYVAIGFPASKSKFDSKKNELKSTPFIYTTISAGQEVYDRLGHQRYLKIIVHYDKKRVKDYNTGKSLTGPDLFGMSGCGLWRIPPQVVAPSEYIKKSLVGILVEWPIKNRKVIVGTRIDVFTELIREKYRLNITPSTKLKLNI